MFAAGTGQMTKRKPSKNEQKSAATRFQPGNPGGPGRPVGSRNRASIVLDQIASDAGEAILKKMVEAAKDGDLRAGEMVLSRVWPVRKGSPVVVPLPPIKTAADVVDALGALADAVTAGELTPEEGQAVAGVLEAKRRGIETTDLEARITALEKERK
jgi:hypothetical protein